MIESLMLLERLFQLDLERDATWDAMRALDAQVKATDEQIAAASAEQAELAARTAPVVAEAAELQKEIEKLAQRRSRLHGQLERGEIPDYLAGQRQLGLYDEQAAEAELRWMELEESREALDRKAMAVREREKTLRARRIEHQAAVDGEGARLRAELDRLNKERVVRKSDVPEGELREYEALRKLHRDAMVRMVGGACIACRMVHPPQFVLEVKRGSRLLRCRSCTRYFLGVVEPEADEPVSPDE